MSGQWEDPSLGAVCLRTPEGQEQVQSGHRGPQQQPRQRPRAGPCTLMEAELLLSTRGSDAELWSLGWRSWGELGWLLPPQFYTGWPRFQKASRARESPREANPVFSKLVLWPEGLTG